VALVWYISGQGLMKQGDNIKTFSKNINYNQRSSKSVGRQGVHVKLWYTATTPPLLMVQIVVIWILLNKCNATYCNFSHRCGGSQNTVTSVPMANNVVAVDLMKQPHYVIISWQVLNLKMHWYYHTI